MTKVGVIVLTQGTRPADLQAALGSVLDQQNVDLDIVVVGNGWAPVGLPDGVRGLGLPENLGIPAGRNAGVAHVDGEYLLFVDDDARLGESGFLEKALAKFDACPRLGVVQPRVDASEGDAPRRWIPRIRKGDPRRSSPAFVLWEGVLLVRRAAFESAGGWPGAYFYAHEGVELAWRTWDAGYEVLYAGDLVCVHPPINPTRHEDYYRLNARNRVWLARRNLRWPFTWLYVLNWTAIQVARSVRSSEGIASLKPWFAGWREGWSCDPGDRRPLGWSTLWLMARHGRPPVV